ncbi:MAG: hypothetical protein P8046_06300, partial [Anaerolineales bacterium]
MVTFAQSVINSTEMVADLILPEGMTSEDTAGTGEVNNAGDSTLATPTPLPTVAVDSSLCDPDSINITSPVINQEISGEYEITGIVNVDDFGYFVIQFAK